MADTCEKCGGKISWFRGPVVLGGQRYCHRCGPELLQARRAELEALCVRVLVVTTPGLEGHRVTDYFGTASALSIAPMTLTDEITADIDDWLGADTKGYRRMFAALQADVEAKLKLQAAMKGGNAVIGAGFDVEFVETRNRGPGPGATDRKLLISGAGTVVKTEPA